jgi:hypothetical protein
MSKESNAATLVVLAVIIQNHNEALKRVGDDPDKIAKINQQTMDAIRDNVHNITPRES